jgi:hypothetical protein
MKILKIIEKRLNELNKKAKVEYISIVKMNYEIRIDELMKLLKIIKGEVTQRR